MAVVNVTAADFEETVTGNDLVLVDFWADWCGPCKMFAPVYDEVAAANPDVTFAKVDTEAEQELAAQFNIRSIPTLMVVRDKTVVYAEPGALPKPALEKLVAAAKAIKPEDLERARAQAAEQPAE